MLVHFISECYIVTISIKNTKLDKIIKRHFTSEIRRAESKFAEITEFVRLFVLSAIQFVTRRHGLDFNALGFITDLSPPFIIHLFDSRDRFIVNFAYLL